MKKKDTQSQPKKNCFKSYFLLIGCLFFGFLTDSKAQAPACFRVAPESCYTVKKQSYPVYSETWHGDASTPHCVEHKMSGDKDIIKLETDICNYMKTKNPSSTAFADCTEVKVIDIQNIIKPWHLDSSRTNLGKSLIWPNANWSLTKQDYNDYYTHPSDPSKKFSVGSLATNFWYPTPTSRLALNCNMYQNKMLSDGFYGYCTRMALQLYLDEECLDYRPPTPMYIFGRDRGDQTPIDIPFGSSPPKYGKTESTNEAEQVKMCFDNKITSVLLVFDQTGKFDPKSTHTKTVCTNTDGTGLGLTEDGCNIATIKQKIAELRYGEKSQSVEKYGGGLIATDVQQQLFKQDLSSLLVKNCTYSEIVIGRANDQTDLFLEFPATDKGTPEKLPDGAEFFNNYGYDPNGSISFCHENEIYKGTLFMKPADGIISTEKGAGKYVCAEFNLTGKNCKLADLKSYLATKVYNGVLPPILDHPSPPADPARRSAADYAIDLTLLKDATLPETIKLENHNVFKQELSQYLTANCRSNPEPKNPSATLQSYEVDYCADYDGKSNDGKSTKIKYWYEPNDRLLSKDMCEKLMTSFVGAAEMIKQLNDHPSRGTAQEIPVPTPPTAADFYLPNKSCRIESVQAAINGDYLFFKGVQLNNYRELHQQLFPENAQLDSAIAMTLDWLSANAFAQTAPDPDRLNYDVKNGQLDSETIGVIDNLMRFKCPSKCVTKGDTPPLPYNADFLWPSPCALNQDFEKCMQVRYDNGKTCGKPCAPGYIKNDQGVCVSEDFFGWQNDHLRPKYQIGANWDDYEYKGDARDITYWTQRFGAKAINFLAITTVLFAMIAVLRLVLSGGSADELGNLKKVAQWSVIALIVAIFAYVIVKTVISMTYWG